MSIPLDYCDLDSTSMLTSVDLVTLAEELADFLDCGREDLVGWYRSLAIALFERFNLLRLPQQQAVAEATQGAALLKVLGVVGGARPPQRPRPRLGDARAAPGPPRLRGRTD
ncbi:hypothetical protein [Corallococcus sp. CA049B]|uniref:hypothetical protein n=1 Tax=Corallococcus sp. CA049B TaxID=2316730 RepID=UPI0011C3D60A|nr:hypothetical protein [Corallococcus sp. CA049B]